MSELDPGCFPKDKLSGPQGITLSGSLWLLGLRKVRLVRDVNCCLFCLREALPGLDPQAASNHTYYHWSRQGVAAPGATLDSHELESLMSPLPEDAPMPLGDITELTEVHSLIHTSLPEDVIHGKRKVRTHVCGDGLPP